MFNFKRIISPIVLIALLTVGGFQSPAQNMSGTVVERQVKFAKGKSSATLRGKASYGMSYVYHVQAKKGQHMSVQLTSDRELATFSLIAPDTQTVENAFGTKDWSGDLTRTGDYSIVVVMNDEKSANVSYALEVAIK